MKSITEQELASKLPPHLSIKAGTFTKMKQPAIFIDSEYGEFEAIPDKVLHRNKMHPLRSKATASDRAKHASISGLEKRKATCIEKYGVDSPIKSESIRSKMQETLLSRTGHRFAMQNQDTKDKAIQSNQERFGVDWAVSSEDFRNKCLDTLEERTGSRIPIASDEAKRKLRETCLKKYGVDNPSKHESVIAKIIEKQNTVYADNLYTSSPERELIDWITELGLKPSKGRAGSFSLDIVVDKIAIEFNGLYWHSEKKLLDRNVNPRLYHLNKTEAAAKEGLELIHVWEHLWTFRKDQTKNFLRAKLGKTKSVGARKCLFREVDRSEASEFIENNHIQGCSNRSFCFIGGFFEEELVTVASFSRHHRNNKQLVLDRFCSKDGITVVGALSKISKMAKEKFKEPIISWADRAISNGNGYLKAGWRLESVLGPDYFYYSPKDKKNPVVPKQSRKKSTIGTPEGMTESEHAEADGLMRVWDCGKLRFILD